MSRSPWAPAMLAGVFAFALTPLVAMAASPASTAHAKQASQSGPIARPAARRGRSLVPAITPVQNPPPLAHGASRRVSVLLTSGSGYQQPAGSGRVRALQRRLVGLGFSPGRIDGRYGPLTTQAVDRFQSAQRLTVDGVVGPHTLSALNAIPTARLRPGAGYQQPAGLGRVRALQRRLEGLGFSAGPIDGRYGPLTTQAVNRFQSAHRLTVNGIVGASTLRALSTHQNGRVPSRRRKNRPAAQTRPVPGTHPAPVAGSVKPRHQPKDSSAAPMLLVLVGLLTLALLIIALSYARARARARRSYARFSARFAQGHDEQAVEFPIAPVASSPRSLTAPQDNPAAESNPVPEVHPVAEIRPVPEVHPVAEIHPVPEVHPVAEIHPVPEVHPVPQTGSALARRERSRSSHPLVPQMLMGLAALALAIISRSYGRARSKHGGRRQ